MHKITIERYVGEANLSREGWKDLISALVLSGYEVYGDEDKLTFTLGDGDTVEELL